MTSPLYARLESTARRLISQYGKGATLLRLQESGEPYAPDVTVTEVPVRVVETGQAAKHRADTLIQVGDVVGIISTEGLDSAPSMADKIIIDGRRLNFVSVEPVSPGSATLLYEFVARA